MSNTDTVTTDGRCTTCGEPVPQTGGFCRRCFFGPPDQRVTLIEVIGFLMEQDWNKTAGLLRRCELAFPGEYQAAHRDAMEEHSRYEGVARALEVERAETRRLREGALSDRAIQEAQMYHDKTARELGIVDVRGIVAAALNGEARKAGA